MDAPPPRPPADDLPRIKAERDRQPPERRRSHTPPHRMPSPLRSWLWPLLAILVVAALTLAWLNQDKLRALLPRTHLNTMLIEADQALAAGHLEGSDGSSAHELYARVLAQEPDNTHALNGLHKVGQAELARASSAIKAGDFDAAKQSIANATRLLGGGADVSRVREAQRKAQHPIKVIHTTIDKAQKALAAGRVAGPDGAAALYHDVLETAPDNAVARHGLEQAGDVLASRVRDALHQGDIDTASSLIAELAKFLPRSGDLPALRADLSQAKQAAVAALKTHLDQGQQDLHAGRFTGPGDDNALAQFQAALKIDQDNADARAGLRQVAQALILRANAAMDADDADQAASLLDKADGLAPQSADLAVAKARLAAMQGDNAAPAASGIATVTTDSHEAHPALTPLQQVEIQHLNQRAQAAAKAGHIMLPPGDSAYDLYREALTIDGNNAKALAGLKALSGITIKRFNQALAAHQLERANGYLINLRSLEPGSTEADAMAGKLADAWLDKAQSSVEEGNRVAALKALDAARKLAPESPRVQAMAKRLHNG
jgi:tetratricopeptide (TPR) repeat protein